MRQAGIREARQNLSLLLQFVAQGHEISITDRGRPVARLVAPLPLSPKGFPDRSKFRRSMPTFEPPVSVTVAGARHVTIERSWPKDLVGPLYLDGSAIAKLYLPERESTPFAKLLEGRRDLTVSDLAVTEVMTFVGQRLVELPEDRRSPTSGELHSALLEDLEGGSFRRVELSPSTHRAAERVALSLGAAHPLRPGQVLHLALALTAGVAALVTFDADLAGAAGALGLKAIPGAKS